MVTKIRTKKQYKAAMKTIDGLLNKNTKTAGFHKMNKDEVTMLAKLSKLAEAYEDNVAELLPMQPKGR